MYASLKKIIWEVRDRSAWKMVPAFGIFPVLGIYKNNAEANNLV